MADGSFGPARRSSVKGLGLALAAFCVLSVLGLGAAGPFAAERDRGSEREGDDRSLDHPGVKRVLEDWREANRRSRAKVHPSFDQLEEPQREANQQRAARAERAERRRDPEQRERRQRSRRAFKDLGERESTQLAQQQFPQLFSPPETEALPLQPGQQVVRYPEDDVALVESASGARSVVDSTVPLVAPEGGSDKPVDYGLERTTDGWEPANAPSPIEFGEHPSEAFSFGDQLEASIPGATGTGTRTANEVFHADVATDTDAWFGPGPAAGVRFAFQLRSADAPEQLRLKLDAGPGAEMSVAPGAKALTVRRGDQVVGRMTAPLAFDADGKEVDVTLSVEGDGVVFDIPHRNLDLAYPAVVDPVYEYANDWKYGNTNYAGWGYYEQVMQFPHGYNAGLYIYRNPNYYWYYGMFAEWSYRAPTAQSFIYRTDFQHVAHAAEATNTTQGMWSTRWNQHQHQFTRGYTFDDAGYAITVCADGGHQAWQCDEAVNLDQSNGNYVQSSLWANANGYRSYYPYMYFGGAYVWMNDVNNPYLMYWHDPGSAWMHDTPAGPYNAKNQSHVRWGDPGLGMWQLWMDVPGMARQYSTDAGGCSGAHSSRCPDSRAHTFSYANISQGTPTVTTTGQDVLGRVASAYKTLRIDRSRPGTPVGSGSLYAQRNGFVSPQTYTLGIQGSDSYSGVKNVSYRVVRQSTGAQVASGSQSNPNCSGTGCSTPWKPPSDFTVDANGWAAGKYTVYMTVKDQLGDDATHGASLHTTTTSFAVEMDRDPPTVAVNHEDLEPWFSDDREIRTTVTGTDSGAGVKSFTLDFPTGADDTRTRTCSGTSATRCPTQDSEVFTYRTDAGRFPSEGRHQLRATVADARGSTATSQPWEVGIDRTAPTIALSGSLYDRRGQELPNGTYQLQVAARDGSDGTMAAERSGVRSVEILLDGETVDFAQQGCANGSCGLDRSWSFATPAHSAGEHILEILSIDQLGHASRDSFRFTSGPCCFGLADGWGSGLLHDRPVFGDVNGDGLTDAVARDTLSREFEVALSTGEEFAEFVPWGRLVALDTVDQIGLGDVNGDGVDDLVGRQPVSGEVVVAASTGNSFDQPQPWSIWPVSRTWTVVDADGDGLFDLVGRDDSTGHINVGYSTGTAFESGDSRTSYAVPSDELLYGDVDNDGAADLVVRDGPSLRVGRSVDGDFEPLANWGSIPADDEVLIGDANGDGADDLVSFSADDGRLSVSESTESSFGPPKGTESFPAGLSLATIDGNGDGLGDVVGYTPITGDLRVATSRMTTPLQILPEWSPDPGSPYDLDDVFSEDETGSDDPPDPPADPVATSAARRPPKMRLAFQDDRRLLTRIGLPGPRDEYIGEQEAFVPGDAEGQQEEEAVAALNRIYARLKEAGGTNPAAKPIIRFQVIWGNNENRNGTFYWDQPGNRLDKAVNLAKANGFDVYLTLTGATNSVDCRSTYNPAGRGCLPNGQQGSPTGVNPDVEQYKRFVRAAVGHFKDRVSTYGIWNEPNLDGFLRVTAANGERLLPAYRYRRLYNAAWNAIKAPDGVFRKARVMLGELSYLRTSGRLATGPRRNKLGVNALRFLGFVVAPNADAPQRVLTSGVAWHPYQHSDPPRDNGRKDGVGIGRTGAIQDQIRRLYFDRDPTTNRPLLATGNGKIPALHFTEFGYFNTPREPLQDNNNRRSGNKYWQTEAARASFFRGALERARREGVRFIVLYTATEISPQREQVEDGEPPPYPNGESFDLEGKSHRQEYGLFSRRGEVTGLRPYGKDPSGRNFRSLNFPQERRAYCTIHKWAFANDYRPFTSEGGCPP